MDSKEFQELLSANVDKFSKILQKNGTLCEAVNAGIENDSCGHLVLRLGNKGGNHAITCTELQSIDFHE